MKITKLFPLLPLSLASIFALTGCKDKDGVRVLRILNCEDYIYEYEEGDEEYASEGSDAYKMDMVDQFVKHWAKNHKGEEIEIVYDTFDTNETMFNELQTGKTTYDVIVPSDYMVQKLISNNMLEKFDESVAPSLWKNISPYLKDKFDSIKAGEESISAYSVPYMWGTVGVMYNPEFYDLEEEKVHELFQDWDSLYGKELKGSFSIKDSVRDTYAVSLIHNFRKEIASITDNKVLTSIFNRNDEKTMKAVKADMLKLKENAFGFECDSGKTDMTTQKIGANMCWSGDATWAITEAEDNDLTLYYSIPTSYNGDSTKGASNVWFDGFCMPKGADKEIAQEFIKFMSQPENAAQNCYCVGYTPGVAGEGMLDYVLGEYESNEALASYQEELDGLDDKYAALKKGVSNAKKLDELNKAYEEEKAYLKDAIKEEQDWITENEGSKENYYDLRYFYGSDCEEAYFLPRVGSVGRQLTAQYPSSEILDRLAIMNDFGPEGNARLLDMWEQVRTNALPTWGIIILAVEGVAALALAAYLITHKINRKRFKKIRNN